MVGLGILVLIVGALFAAVYGRGVAQGVLTAAVMLGSVSVGAFTLFVGFLILVTPSWRPQVRPAPYVLPAAETPTQNSAPADQRSGTAPAQVAPMTVVRVGLFTRMLTSEEDARIGLYPAPGYPWPVGLCVVGVAPGSGAAEAGIRPGDFVTKVFASGQWRWITAQDGLTNAVEAAPAGAFTWIELVRGGRIYWAAMRAGCTRPRPDEGWGRPKGRTRAERYSGGGRTGNGTFLVFRRLGGRALP